MGCDFSLAHYQQILSHALNAGYVVAGFHEEAPPSRCGDRRVLYLRHDLDVSPAWALPMARLEAEMGVRSTYFLLVNSPLYNLFEDVTTRRISEIVSLGHWVGLHVDLGLMASLAPQSIEDTVDKLFTVVSHFFPVVRVVSFHRPTASILNRSFSSFTSTYEPRFFTEIKYLSDSRGMWREGCPCESLRSGSYNAVQILTHPIWWGRAGDLASLMKEVILLRTQELKSWLAANISPFQESLARGGDQLP